MQPYSVRKERLFIIKDGNAMGLVQDRVNSSPHSLASVLSFCSCCWLILLMRSYTTCGRLGRGGRVPHLRVQPLAMPLFLLCWLVFPLVSILPPLWSFSSLLVRPVLPTLYGLILHIGLPRVPKTPLARLTQKKRKVNNKFDMMTKVRRLIGSL